MKKLAITIILSLVILMSIGAQVRVDINISVPIYVGIEVEGSGGIGDFTSFVFILPDIMVSYVIDADMIKVGLGARMFTFLVESVMWPNAFVEVDLAPLVLNLSVGGGAFFYFGVESGADFNSLFIPDFCAYFKFNEWFQAGAGVVLFVGSEIFGVDIIPYAIYVRGRFSFNF